MSIDWDVPEGRYVYLFASEDLTKIGSTGDVGGRLSTLQANSAVPIHVRCSFGPFADGDAIEYGLHRIFRSKRHHGEWFDLTTKEIKAVESILGLMEDLYG